MTTHPPDPDAAPHHTDVAARLRARFGLDARRLGRVVEALASGPRGPQRLAAEAGVPESLTRDVLDELADLVEPAGGGKLKLREESAGRTGPGWEPVDTAAIASRVAALASARPAPRRDADHFPADPPSVAGRVHVLSERYDLAERAVLMLGDHDLTSLALAAAGLGSRITVVDFDEELLEFIDHHAPVSDPRPTLVAADLRLSFPASLEGRFDLVVTDPPYTPAGMELFLGCATRALARDRGVPRIVFNFGFSLKSRERALAIQEILQGLGLVVEFAVPEATRYEGAESIGSASTLYGVMATPATWSAVAGLAPGADIYTGGRYSASARRRRDLPAGFAGEVVGTLGDSGSAVLAGEGWPAAVPGERVALSKAAIEAAPAGPVAARLHAPAANLLRVRLWARSRPLALVWEQDDVPDAEELFEPGTPAGRLLHAGADIRLLADDGGFRAAVCAPRHPDPAEDAAGYALSRLAGHTGVVANGWKEALIAAVGARGGALTQREARAAIAATGIRREITALRLDEVPRHALAELVPAVVASVAELGIA